MEVFLHHSKYFDKFSVYINDRTDYLDYKNKDEKKSSCNKP